MEFVNILILAAENAALTGGKVGGIGDVVRDIAPGLAELNCTVSTVVPSYGRLHRINPSQWVTSVSFPYGSARRPGELFRVDTGLEPKGVSHYIIDHPLLSAKGDASFSPKIYSHDPPDRPYATDSTKFALFCSAAAALTVLDYFGPPDCIHLHDWHTAFFLILRKYHPDFQVLRGIRTVYTIHNLSLQGVRPFRGSDSSLEAWYPDLLYETVKLSDPRWPECVNPMAAGIRMSDVVHTVSPTYAEEILKPSCSPHRFSGGEGLEADLQEAKKEGRLFGILNGCRYPKGRTPPRLEFHDLIGRLKAELLCWCGAEETVSSGNFLAFSRLTALEALPEKPALLLTSVSRVVEQKMLLLQACGSNGMPGLHTLLETLGRSAVYILLGQGERKDERFLIETCARFENFIFLNGYSDASAEALYANGDLFLMPSSFEPCGIGQMLAMRDGQVCVVHAVGGLKDTVRHGSTGFVFGGYTLTAQVDQLISAVRNAASLKAQNDPLWQQVRRNAASQHFLWKTSLEQYIEKLYRGSSQ
ncbi:MAG: glycogen synthase [Desulfobacteraceae bacterium]|nr:MAG: glycogen synthase [Desulfobacteraceae bacterium]